MHADVITAWLSEITKAQHPCPYPPPANSHARRRKRKREADRDSNDDDENDDDNAIAMTSPSQSKRQMLPSSPDLEYDPDPRNVRQPAPFKRPRADDEVSKLQLRQPTATTAQDMPMDPERPGRPSQPLPPPSSHYATVLTTASTINYSTLPSEVRSAGSRSSSPSKAVNPKMLRDLLKEVVFTEGELRKSILPDDGKRLWARLQPKAVRRYAIFPRQIKDDIIRLVGDGDDDEIPDTQFGDIHHGGPGQDCCTRDAHLAILEQVKIILRESQQCSTFFSHESAWNVQVHYPVMTLPIPSARSLQPGPVGIETITTATIAPPFQPLFKWSESLQINSSTSQSRTQPPAPATPRAKNLTLQKLVDFALVLRTDYLDPEHDNLYARVDALRVAQPAGQLTISPSNAGKLTYFPVAVAIETKTGMGNTAEGHLQLGAWAASWHRRMFLLARNYGIVGSEDVSLGRAKRFTTLPLIFVNGAEWQLYLAIDESSSIPQAARDAVAAPSGPARGSWEPSLTLYARHRRLGLKRPRAQHDRTGYGYVWRCSILGRTGLAWLPNAIRETRQVTTVARPLNGTRVIGIAVWEERITYAGYFTRGMRLDNETEDYAGDSASSAPPSPLMNLRLSEWLCGGFTGMRGVTCEKNAGLPPRLWPYGAFTFGRDGWCYTPGSDGTPRTTSTGRSHATMADVAEEINAVYAIMIFRTNGPGYPGMGIEFANG
ncbi:hypothetical protein CMUS01_14815 [Colletotrichum musicola]|uniref:PD-(D/E)XK nuclease-like domain-containing protein n=1 Tax=Colletotrichum musicola TaxID=2175873 RepID=A0A8H6J1E0_9PEZI|nr:hypothetical protein CMUS01_14815 [Colletotrichum musicola]